MAAVLLVDDSQVVLRALGARLRAEGFDVREESTAAGARRVDSAQLGCAVLDVDLTDGDGATVAAALRARCPSLPVAFFTAGEESSLLERAREQGPVFQKPDVDAVATWVRHVLATAHPPPTK
jgi:two-component system response regulator FixJ